MFVVVPFLSLIHFASSATTCHARTHPHSLSIQDMANESSQGAPAQQTDSAREPRTSAPEVLRDTSRVAPIDDDLSPVEDFKHGPDWWALSVCVPVYATFAALAVRYTESTF